MKIRKLIVSTLFFYMILISASCTDDAIITPREYPRLETLEVTNISESGATFNAKIIHPGNQKILEYGFVWDWYRYDPNLESNRVFLTETLTTEEFSSNITTTLFKNISYSVKAFVKTEEYTVYGNSMGFKSLGSKAAIIDDFFPKKGTWGDTIQIIGKNFSYLSDNNGIFFKDVKSKVISSTDSIIKCIVPEGILGKTARIYLNLAGQKTYAKEEFELTIPEIVSFSPLKGTFNDTIKLIGKNFNAIKYKNIVSFNGNQVEVIDATKTSLLVIIPTSIISQWNEIEITVNLQSNISKEFFEIFAPKIEDINPKLEFSNSTIKITGNYFNPYKLGDTVLFDNNIGQVIEATKKEISVKIPNGIYTNRSFKVGVKVAGQTTYSSSKFTLSDPWIRKTDIPFERYPRYNATGFSVLNKGYVGLGLGNTLGNYDANSDFFKYDPIQNTWEKLSDFGGGGRYNATSFVIGNYAYVGSGITSSSSFQPTDDFWKFDPINESWTKITKLPISTENAVGLSVNGNGYICTPSNIDNFWKYDPSTNQWTQLPDLVTIQSGAKGKADSGFVIGDKIYIYVSGNSTGLHQLFEFDTNTLQWTRKADMINSGIRQNVVGFSIKDKGYIIDIYYVHEYDPNSDTWSIKESIPGRSRNNGIVFEIDGKVYFGSGNQRGSSASDFWEYNLDY